MTIEERAERLVRLTQNMRRTSIVEILVNDYYQFADGIKKRCAEECSKIEIPTVFTGAEAASFGVGKQKCISAILNMGIE